MSNAVAGRLIPASLVDPAFGLPAGTVLTKAPATASNQTKRQQALKPSKNLKS